MRLDRPASPARAPLRRPTSRCGTRTCLAGALLLLAAQAAAKDLGTGIPGALPRRQAQAVGPGIDDRSLRETAPTSREADLGEPDSRLPFVSTPDLRRATVERHLRSLRATNPIAAAEAGRELAKHDYDAIFRGFLDGTGLDPEDGGDVLTAFIALQWMVANDATAEPSPAALRAIRRRFVMPMAAKPPLSQPASRAAFAEQVKLRSVLHHAGWQAARQLGVLPRFLATLSNEFIPAAKLQALALTEDGLVAKGQAGARPSPALPPPPSPDAAPPAADTPPAPPPSAGAGPDASAPPRHAANWDAVEGVYFRATTGVGVGGMVTIDFEPLIFLQDGTTYEIGGSVGAVNSGASTGVGTAMGRRRAPEGGQYRLDRHTLTLTGADGRSRRLFFAYSSQKDPPEVDRDMIFVGDSVFSSED